MTVLHRFYCTIFNLSAHAGIDKHIHTGTLWKFNTELQIYCLSRGTISLLKWIDGVEYIILLERSGSVVECLKVASSRSTGVFLLCP